MVSLARTFFPLDCTQHHSRTSGILQRQIALSLPMDKFPRLSPMALVLAFAAVVAASPLPPRHSTSPVSSSLQNVLTNTHGSRDYGYPTDFTRGIMPVRLPVHSLPTGEIQRGSSLLIHSRRFLSILTSTKSCLPTRSVSVSGQPTRNIAQIPLTCSSDYWRDVPFYTGKFRFGPLAVPAALTIAIQPSRRVACPPKPMSGCTMIHYTCVSCRL